MILHPILINDAAEALRQIFFEGRKADKVIEYTLKANPKRGSKDRAFIAETVYEIVRRKRLYEAIADFEIRNDKKSFWVLFGAYWLSMGNDLPDFSELKELGKKDLRSNFENAKKVRKIYYSVSDELDELGFEQLGENWEKELDAMNRQAEVYIRCNTLKTSTTQLKQNLTQEGIHTEELAGQSDALVLRSRKSLFSLPLFQNGHFEVQDAGSQMIAPFLEVQPGMRVIDACAGAGGKSLHLAALMQNKGKIVCMDVEQNKLDELNRRAKRAGATCIETRLIEGSKSIKRLENSADRLLLDVPCTGSGVLKRNPDAKYKIDAKMLENLCETQSEILNHYSQMLKSGGKMIYATCSIFPAENQNQVQKFLSQNPNYSLESELHVLPSTHGFDGFYMARITKTN